MYEVPSDPLPYRAICYIECRWSDGLAIRASAVIVGTNDVLTALHALYRADAGWASSVRIIPGADTEPSLNMPYGQFTDVGFMVGRAPAWDANGDGLLSPGEIGSDLALIGLYSRIADVAGALPVRQEPGSFQGLMAGYPASGTGLMVQDVVAQPKTQYGYYEIAGGLGAGASGGPLLEGVGDDTAVTGILSAGTFDNRVSSYAGLFDPATWQWLQQALAANDGLLGLSTTRRIDGTAGNDRLIGSTGAEVFMAGAGDDDLDGAGGVDKAVYAGRFSDYRLDVSGAVWTVTDGVAGREGTDRLTGVERLVFSDRALAFDIDGPAGQAYRLYQAAFDRMPDAGGLGFHIRDLEAGWGIADIARNFIASPEFASRYGVLDNTSFVQQLYRNVLGREGESAGVAYHLARLADGATRADILVGFSESPENKAALVGVMDDGMVYIP